MSNVDWNYPTAIKFGAGRVTELPRHVMALGMERPLLVTDKALANLPIAKDALASLTGAAMFSEVKSNPTDENLEAGLAAYHDGKHDGVIAFGGGSALDLGKAIAFMTGQSRHVWDFEDIGDWWTRADPKGIASVVAVPTTAGTGSEVGRASVLTDTKAYRKKVIFHPRMMPSIVICDPQLSIGMPRFVTAGTGLDALSHCLEAYCSPSYHPMATGIAVEGIRLVLENLPKVFLDPNDIIARGHMMSAALMGATAFQKGLGGMHALAHPIGALYDTHHGMTNAVVMPYVLEANRPAIEARINRLSRYLDISNGFDGFLEHLRSLRKQLEVPETLIALGVPRSGFQKILSEALVDPSANGNPLKFDSELGGRMLDMAFG